MNDPQPTIPVVAMTMSVALLLLPLGITGLLLLLCSNLNCGRLKIPGVLLVAMTALGVVAATSLFGVQRGQAASPSEIDSSTVVADSESAPSRTPLVRSGPSQSTDGAVAAPQRQVDTGSSHRVWIVSCAGVLTLMTIGYFLLSAARRK